MLSAKHQNGLTIWKTIINNITLTLRLSQNLFRLRKLNKWKRRRCNDTIWPIEAIIFTYLILSSFFNWFLFLTVVSFMDFPYETRTISWPILTFIFNCWSKKPLYSTRNHCSNHLPHCAVCKASIWTYNMKNHYEQHHPDLEDVPELVSPQEIEQMKKKM